MGYRESVRDLPLLDLTLRLVVAAGVGLILGFERELRSHPAGARTHALVAVGAALFTVAGAYGFADVPHGPNVDPAGSPRRSPAGWGFSAPARSCGRGWGCAV
jgi:putative Mg2+ transporter-C (MgtC) family protein